MCKSFALEAQTTLIIRRLDFFMSTIIDSGERRKFESGAVRDIQEGKGRCDLLPLDIVAPLMDSRQSAQVIYHIGQYMQTGQDKELYLAIRAFNELRGGTTSECILEVSKHYEDGAVKYGERNWEKGINLHCYIDSGVRHFLKWLAKDTDECHDRAFVWNMLGAIWTEKHHSSLVDIPKYCDLDKDASDTNSSDSQI